MNSQGSQRPELTQDNTKRLAFLDRAESKAKWALVVGLAGCIICAVVFIVFPQIDLVTSQFFYREPQAGAASGFWLSDSRPLKFFFWLVDAVSRVVLVATIGLTIYYAIKKHPRLLASAIVTFSLVLGPAVVVNAIYKDHWDRARPRQIVEFGGTKQFTPAWVVSNQCPRNCSFTSGHAAAGFSFLVGHFVSRGRFWLWLAAVFGGLTGLTRIMVGAHFLSDVVFSFFTVYLVAALVTFVFARIARANDRRKAA